MKSEIMDIFQLTFSIFCNIVCKLLVDCKIVPLYICKSIIIIL